MQFANDSIMAFATSPLTRFNQRSPRELTGNAPEAAHQLLEEIGGSYHVVGAVAIHHTADLSIRLSRD